MILSADGMEVITTTLNRLVVTLKRRQPYAECEESDEK